MSGSTRSGSLHARVSRAEERAGRGRSRGATRWLVLGLMAVVAAAVAAPLILMSINAFKSDEGYLAEGPLAIPQPATLANIIEYMDLVDFWQKLANSVTISLGVAIGASLLSLLSAYAIGVGRIRGRRGILTMFLVANIIPQESLIYPLFTGVQSLGALQSTVVPVTVILVVLQAAFGTYLISSVLNEFPRALLEAAEMDGASKWRILWSVVFPVVRPTMAVLFVLMFIWSWNDFFIPFVLLTSGNVQTVPIALASLQGDRFLDATATAAGAFISLLPTLIFFLVFQRTLVRGVAVGAIK